MRNEMNQPNSETFSSSVFITGFRMFEVVFLPASNQILSRIKVGEDTCLDDIRESGVQSREKNGGQE